MNALSKAFPLHQTSPRSLWRESGVGLAIILTVLVMTVMGVRGNPGFPTVGPWPGAAQPAGMTGWDNGGPSELLPLDPMTIDAPT
jgi:hypothetical protein